MANSRNVSYYLEQYETTVSATLEWQGDITGTSYSVSETFKSHTAQPQGSLPLRGDAGISVKILVGNRVVSTSTKFGFYNPNTGGEYPLPYKDSGTLTITEWPLKGEVVDGAVNATLRFYDIMSVYNEETGQWEDHDKAIADIPIKASLDVMPTEPKLNLSEGDTLGNYISPAGTIPETWPFLVNLEGAKAKFRFNVDTLISYYGSAKFSSGEVELVPVKSGPVVPPYPKADLGQPDENGWCETLIDMLDYAGTDASEPSMYDFRIKLLITDDIGKTGTFLDNVYDRTYRYIKPTLSLNVERCNESGVADDEGLYAKLVYDAYLWNPPTISEGSQYANRIVSTKTLYKDSSSTEWSALSDEKLSPNVANILGGSLDPLSEYDIQFALEDLTGSTSSKFGIVDPAYCTIDFLSGGRGIAFGKTSDKEGFENDMESFFNKPVHIIDSKLHVDKMTESSGTEKTVPMFEVNEDGIVTVSRVFDKVDPENSSDIYKVNFFEVDPIYGKVKLHYLPASDSNEYAKHPLIEVDGVAAGLVKTVNPGSSWWQARDRATVRSTVTPGGGYGPIASMKTDNGNWSIGVIRNLLAFSYYTDTDYANPSHPNPTKQIFVDPSQTGLKFLSNVGGKSLLDLIYPVGSIYMSAVNTSPASFAGGTWTALPNGYYLRSANGFSTGGANGHTHSVANSVGVCLTINSDKYVYARVLKGNTWTANTWGGFTSMGSGSYSESWYTEPYGNTQSTNHYPACQNVYAWRRTA